MSLAAGGETERDVGIGMTVQAPGLPIHSVLGQIQIKGPYLDQRLPLHESLYPIGLISARIEILHGGNFFTK